MLYPLAVGQTTITITANKNESETISIICTVIVEEYEQELGLQIYDSNGVEKTSNFMSGLKANGQYEIYTAQISSLRNLENKIDIISENISILDSSKLYYKKEGIYFYSFDFYFIDASEHTLQATTQETYSNLEIITYSPKVAITSTNFVQGLSAIISRENGDNSLTQEKDGLIKHILYCTDYTKIDLVDENGYYNNYILNIYDLSDNLFKNFSLELEENSILEIIIEENVIKIIAKELGESFITISALDGSGQKIIIYFEVKEIDPTLLKLGNIDLLSTYSQEDLINEIGDITIYESNELGKPSTAELSINIASKFVKDSYVYFESLNSDLETTVCETEKEDGSIIKTFMFEAQNPGTYAVNLIVNGNVIYTFDVTVLDSKNHFEFSTEDTNPNIVYDFENREITLSEYSQNNMMLNFVCGMFDANNEEQDQDVKLEYNKEYCISDAISIEYIYLYIMKSGTFTLTITELNSDISTVFTIIINE